MLNLCSRKWGLAISITRFVHFGELPAELGRAIQVCGTGQCRAARRDPRRRNLGGTLQGGAGRLRGGGISRAKSNSITRAAPPATESANGWRLPTALQTVVNNQAFAWNPSIRGGKAEDTVLLRDGKIEWLTATPDACR